MGTPFQFTAQLNLHKTIGNYRNIQRKIQKLGKYGTIKLELVVPTNTLGTLTKLEQQLQQIEKTAKKTNQALKITPRTQQSIKSTGQHLRSTTNDLTGFSHSMGLAAKRATAFWTSFGSGVLILNQIKRGIREIPEETARD